MHLRWIVSSIQIIPEFGTRFAMLQAGDADIVDVPVDEPLQVDAMVGEMRVYDTAANAYGPAQADLTRPGRFGPGKIRACEAGKTGKGHCACTLADRALHQDVITYNFTIK